MIAICELYSELEEGFIRGAATELEDIGTDLKSIGDLFYLTDEKALAKVESVINDLKLWVSTRKGYQKPDTGFITKLRATMNNWRYYYYLNDEFFKYCKEYVAKTGKDPIGYTSTAFGVRKQTLNDTIYNANSPEEINKLLDLYVSRMKEIYDLKKSNPHLKGYGPFLRQGLYGLRDLVIVVRKLVAYHS